MLLTQDPVLLIDSNNLLNRTFHALPLMTNKSGFPTNAIRGWCNTIQNLTKTYHPKQTIAVFDGGTPPDRTKILPQYKANRKPKDPHLLLQMTYTYDHICKAQGINPVRIPNEEADDIIASLSKTLETKGEVVLIFSGDKDLAQTITQNTSLIRPSQNGTFLEYQLHNAQEILGIQPYQVPDFLAITGDSVDNIPGLKGAGPKTAITWLEKYNTLHRILEIAPQISPKRFQGPLLEQRDTLLKNLQITKARQIELPIPSPIPPNQKELTTHLEILELWKVLQNLEI